MRRQDQKRRERTRLKRKGEMRQNKKKVEAC